MANKIDVYDPIFYANEALAAFEASMGMASRVYRGYDAEKTSVDKGSTIRIRKPSTFNVQEGGLGAFQDIETDYLDVVVNDWKEVKIKLSDKELALSSDKLISDHIRPAAYALSKYVNQQCGLLAQDIPWQVDLSASGSDDDLILPRGVIRENTGDLLDMDLVHFGIDNVMESRFLKSDIFKNASVTGQGGNQTLYNASLGQRFNVETFVDQTLGTHVGGTVMSGADQAGTVLADATKGTTSVALTGLTGAETLKKGDSFVIAGDAQRYVITADATLTAGAATVQVYPKLVMTYVATSAVTFEPNTTAAKKYARNLMFHPNAFAIAFAPLPELGNGLGANMATIVDPKTNLSIRSRIAYNDANAFVSVTLDILFGVKTINDKLACVARRAIA